MNMYVHICVCAHACVSVHVCACVCALCVCGCVHVCAFLVSTRGMKFVEQRVFLLKWVVSIEVLYCCSRKKSVGVILEKNLVNIGIIE